MLANGLQIVEQDLENNLFTVALQHLSEFALYAQLNPTGLPQNPQPEQGGTNLFLPALNR